MTLRVQSWEELVEKIPEHLHSVYSVGISNASRLEVAPKKSYIGVRIFPTRSGSTSQGWDVVKAWLDMNVELQS